MEKFKTRINSQAFIFIALFIGTLSLLFIGQEKQYGIFAWISPLFLLHFTRNAKPFQFLYLFVLLIVAGYITQKTHNLFNHFGFGLLNGIFYALIFETTYILDRLLYFKRKAFLSTLIFPAVFVLIEAVVTLLIGTSGVLAQSQFSFEPLAQFSTLAGLQGITFIICWFAAVVYWLFENDFTPSYIKKSLVYYGSIFIVIIAFGFLRMMLKSEVQQTIKVATVSGPFHLHQFAQKEKEALLQLEKNPNMKIPSRYFSSEIDISLQLNNTKKAAEAGAKIIVWNEAALFLNDEQLPFLIAEVKKIATSLGSYILMAFFEENNSTGTKPLNNKCILISSKGTIEWEYKKSHLSPGEIPFVNPGDSIIPVCETEFGKISNVICYDYDYPSLLKQANKNKVDIMLVPSYDWEGFASHHSKMAQFETLQSGRMLIRSNGNGINIVADSYGKVIAELNTFTNTEPILLADLPLHSSPTIYALTGNIFVIVCFIIFIWSLFSRINTLVKSKRK